MERVTELPHIAKIILGLTAVFVAYQIVQYFTVGRKRQAIAREKGCVPAKSYPQRETIIGYDIFRTNIQALKAHKFLELQLGRFKEMGINTYQMVALGRRFIITTEPENLKTIQATSFKSWSLGSRRKTAFRPLLGDGKLQSR